MVPLTIPSLELLRDLPLKIAIPDDLRSDVAACLARPISEEDPGLGLQKIAHAEEVTLRAIAHLDAEAARLTQERFAAEDAGVLRRRLVEDPRVRAEALIATMKQRVANDRTEWSRRLDKQTRDVLEAMRAELSTMELESVEGTKDPAVRSRPGFRKRFGNWADTAMDAWTLHLGALVVAQYTELIRPDLDLLETLLGVSLDPVMPVPSLPAYRVQIPDSLHQATYEPPSLTATFLGSFKGGLDVVALLTGLLVVPVVGQLMDESPAVVRAGVVGSMIFAALVTAVLSSMRTRSKLLAGSISAARTEIVRAIEASFVGQVERFRGDVERHCSATMHEALRAALRVAEPALARFVEQREASTVSTLANAQLKLDRIADQLRSIRAVKYALEEQLLVDLRRSLNQA